MIIEDCTQCPFHQIGERDSNDNLVCICRNPQVYNEKTEYGYRRYGGTYPIVCEFHDGNPRLRPDCKPFPSWCPLQAFNPIQSTGFWGVVTVAPPEAWTKYVKTRPVMTLDNFGEVDA